jgi:hypothetical protein
MVLFFYLLCLKIGLICFTYENFYQFLFYSSKLIPISVEITALALSYHLFNGVSHLGGLAGRWNFKSLKYFVFWLTVYAALAVIPVPSDLFLERIKVILILGGSAALYFVGLASTPLEKEFCLNGLFLSSLSAATLWNMAEPTWNIAEPTGVFLSILIYLSARLFLPVDFLFFLVLLGRVFLFIDYGPALFIQTYFVYGLRKWRKNCPLLVAIYITTIFGCIWLGHVMLKGILFPLSGALAIFFFFVATSGKEHILASLFYLINQLFLCFKTGNKEAAIGIIYIYAFLILVFMLFTIFMRINDNDRDNDRKVSKFTDYCFSLIFEGKIKFFFVFFGLIFRLLPVSGSEQWVRALAETLFLQVAFLNLFIFFFRSLTKDREGGLPPAGHRLIDEMIEKRTTCDLIP